jgi:2-polyprenyl-3-methyl-5-hydroxy-6-metoxy-1,4-benzoquinol methylase
LTKRVEAVARHFDDRASRYDNPLTTFIGEQELRVIRPLVPAGAQVLDYGCGTGRAALDHLRRGCHVTAFDISRNMLARAEQGARAEGWLARAEFTADESALAGRTWPVVTAIGVLDYYAEPTPLLRTLSGYMAPGGCLVVTYPNALSPLAWLYALGSRFTFPAIPRTSAFARRAAEAAGLQVAHLAYAFPPVAPLGHTLVLKLTRR